MTSTRPGTDLAVIGDFGPYDALADVVHGLYLDGVSTRAVDVARTWLALTEAAGDVLTSRYLRYIAAIALQDYGRHGEAVAEATALAESLGNDSEPVWRAKALAVLAESAVRIGEHGRAIAALAEADWHLRSIRVGTYGHLSASMAVALSMRSLNLLEDAETLLVAIQDDGSTQADLLIALESAGLSAYWGTALVTIGRQDDAGVHFVVCAQRAVRARRIAERLGDVQMTSRAEVVEAFALMHLGLLDLAAARARAAAERATFRIELVDTYLLHLVLGRAAVEEGRLDEARERLTLVQRSAASAGREVWSVAATGALADLHTVEFGPHEGMDLWRSVAQEALQRSWSEREGRFAALQDRSRLRELTAHSARMGRAAVQDPLTGLGNRRMLQEASETNGGAARPTSVIFIDVDQFKDVNDTHTHAVGDAVLREVATILRVVSREEDMLIRFGGDEFLILSTGPLEGAVALAHRVHGAVRAHSWDHVAPGLEVTVSIGVGRVAETGHASMLAADGALMSAKRSGRDRVVVDEH
ncbi:diguanylate cyclase [Cellulomonas sp. ATA003]|uniref:GGDEF domain-containing protein n=1 Tax=Cellulomonas sp. ATA003 TaxID=3073064 RepID=UPI0028736FFB|nr:diguanylate cyclase [Cellulomonas sp. ATA003]WNB85615.1 diguanylate cyclase [Cellulomonas sp. ATA003]